MTQASDVGLRTVLVRVRDLLAKFHDGQGRLDKIVGLIAEAMGSDVCSIYLLRDKRTLELCATKGLKPEAVHQTRLRLGEGLVGRVAKDSHPINTAEAPSASGFRYMPETGEEIYNAFLGVPLQREGETVGVLVVQSREKRAYTEHQIADLGIIAMVLAEMKETGAFTGEGAALAAPHTQPVTFRGTIAHEGITKGAVVLHEPRVVIANPVSDDPEAEYVRLDHAIEQLRGRADDLLAFAADAAHPEQTEVLETYRMFTHSQGWVSQARASIAVGLSAEAAVEKAKTEVMTNMERAEDDYIKARLDDLNDMFNRLLRILTGQGRPQSASIPREAILVARNIGPGELLDYGRRAKEIGRKLKGVVLEEGSVGSHATIVAQALAIPLVVQVKGIATDALNGDTLLVDAERGTAHLRPDDADLADFNNRIVAQEAAQETFRAIRDEPATTLDGFTVSLHMNAGLLGDLPSLESSGAEGVGLFRTELRFLSTTKVPGRDALAEVYSKIMTSAKGKRIAFRTLDLGSDKMLPYMKRSSEPNPALGLRAIRIALERRGVLQMQLQALIRGANGRPLSVMFPLVAEMEEFIQARDCFLHVLENEKKINRVVPESFEIGAMLETPSLAFAPDSFYDLVDFISIGGNDLKQFFFAADRDNEEVRSRYHSLNLSYLDFLSFIVQRCSSAGTPLSYCGVDAGRPANAACFAAIGLRTLSIRAAAIGRVKHLLRGIRLSDVNDAILKAKSEGAASAKESVSAALGLQ